LRIFEFVEITRLLMELVFDAHEHSLLLVFIPVRDRRGAKFSYIRRWRSLNAPFSRHHMASLVAFIHKIILELDLTLNQALLDVIYLDLDKGGTHRDKTVFISFLSKMAGEFVFQTCNIAR